MGFPALYVMCNFYYRLLHWPQKWQVRCMPRLWNRSGYDDVKFYNSKLHITKIRLHVPIKLVLGLPWPERSGVVINHSPPYTAEVKNEWTIPLLLLYAYIAWTGHLPFEGGLPRIFFSPGRIITGFGFGGSGCIRLQGDRIFFRWMVQHLIIMHSVRT